MSRLEQVERACGYAFKDKELLKKALTLSSFDNSFNNESLECLGDSLLGFIVAEKYYAEGFSEGEITGKKQELLADAALRPVSESLGLDLALIRDKGDNKNKKAVPSVYEALTAAIYLDGGMEAAKRFAFATLSPSPCAFNYVGELQELLQGSGEQLPEYVQTDVGTPRKPWLRVCVKVRGKSFCAEDGNGATAKKRAAKLAYEYCVGERDGAGQN